MPKGKKCVVCNEGNMRRCYTRSYWKGLKFTEEHILGIDTRKGSFKPKGWLCENCGIFIPDESQYFMYLKWNERKENHEKSLNELKEKIDDLKEELSDHQKEYIYTEREIENEKRYAHYRFYNIKTEIGTYQYLKGLRAGNKQSKEFYEKTIKEMKLTDDQILQKAKLIETRRKLGYT